MHTKVLSCACLVLAIGASARVSQASRHVRIEGSTHVEASAAPDHGKLALRGTARDDAGRPLAGAHVSLSLVRASDHVAVSLADAEPCAGASAPPVRVLERADAVAVSTDEGGRFCVRVAEVAGRHILHVDVRAAAFVDEGTADVAVDPGMARVAVRFDPAPGALSLDEPSVVIGASASSDDGDGPAPAKGLALTLSDEKNTVLARATTDASGRATFVVASQALGPPGPGELRVSFDGGTDGAIEARCAAQVQKRTRVDVTAPDAIAQRLPSRAAEHGAPLRVAVHSGCAARACSEPPTGSVEARIDGEQGATVAVAPLENGSAHLSLAFDTGLAEVPIRLRYIPDVPWLLPTAPLLVVQPLAPPSPWGKLAPVAAALGALTWFLLARVPQRPPSSASTQRRQPKPAVGADGPYVVLAGPSDRGWTGNVVDVHGPSPIASARVAIERRTFARIDVLAETRSDENGRFAFPGDEGFRGADLVASHPLYVAVRRPLPPTGDVAVGLVLRRRALLDALVGWARRRGTPYDAQPEATPRHVRKTGASEPAVAAWAGALEEAVYGPDAVNEASQARVEALAPGDDATAGRPPRTTLT